MRLGVALFTASRAAKAGADAELSTLGLDTPSYGILELLADEPATQRSLAERLSIDRTTTMRLIDRLEHAGSLVREPHPRDRRAHLVRVTPAGSRRLTAARAALDRADDRFLAPLSASERAALAAILERLGEPRREVVGERRSDVDHQVV